MTDCGEAGCSEGRCGNASCLPSAKKANEIAILKARIIDLEKVQLSSKILIHSLKVDRHDWEDWPEKSQKAVQDLMVALATVTIHPTEPDFT